MPTRRVPTTVNMVSLAVNCLSCNRQHQTNEEELHLEMPIQTRQISTFLVDFGIPAVLPDYRCPV